MTKDDKSYKIFVIEDNPGDFAIVEDFLTEKILNPDIVHAVNFKQAAAVLKDKNNIFDVILLDLSLPDKDGQNLITEIISIAAMCPIIILTGYADVDFSIKSISLGISDYLLKDDLSAVTLYKSITYAIERRKNIIELKESEKRNSDLFHLSPQPMWVYDYDTLQFLSVNNATINNYGYSEQEFLKMSVKDIVPNQDVGKLDDYLNFSKKSEAPFRKGIFKHQRKEGEIIYAEIQSNIIYFNNRKAELVLANDITERVQYIKAIEEQNQKLQHIAWTQSHIVRAPLARMMGIVNLIKDLDMTSNEYENLMQHFVDSGQELDTIIRDIAKKTERINIKTN